MVLYSIYLSVLSLSIVYAVGFFLKFAKALEYLCTQHGALVELRNESTRVIKREPMCPL